MARRSTALVGSLAALLLATGLTACGGSESESTTTPVPTTATSTSTSTTTTTAPPATSTTTSTSTTTTIAYPYDFAQHPATPVIVPGDWDPGYTATPYVVREGEQWLMFYAGGNATGRSHPLGLATSPDLLTWTKDPDEPLFDSGSRGVAWQTLVNDGESWTMLYATRFNPPYRDFLTAAAPTPTGPWTKQDLEIKGPDNGWDRRLIITGITRVGDTYWAPYAGFPDSLSPPSIGFLTSTDLVTWESQPEPAHAPTPGSWDEFGLVPSNLVETERGLEVFYLGFAERPQVSFQDETIKMGRLLSTDGGLTWTADNDGNPVLDSEERGWPGVSTVYQDGTYYLFLGHELGSAGVALITGTIP